MTLKTVLAASSFIALAATSFAAAAETTNFTAKGAFGHISAFNKAGSINIDVYANTTRTGSQTSNSAGAYANAYIADGTQCWFGWGMTDGLKLTTVGSLPQRLSTSGSLTMYWTEFCSGNNSIAKEVINFNVDLQALRDQASQSAGTSRSQYGPYRTNSTYDYSSAPAAVNSSYITSQFFGTVTPSIGHIGQQKNQSITISK